MPIANVLRLAVAALAMAGCAARAPVVTEHHDFDRGIVAAVDDLFSQVQRLPSFAARAILRPDEKRGVIAVDTIIDAATGQQTHATQTVERRLYERVREKFPQFEVGAASKELVAGADHVLAATMQPQAGDPGAYRLSMSLTDLRGGLVIAQAAARVRDGSVDTTPTPLYRDSPAMARDRVVEGQVRTAETRPGTAADALYLERLPTNALINQGLAAFNGGDFAGAAQYYEEASRRADGQQLRVYNGLYVSYWNTGRAAEAEDAFGKIVGLGLATNNLAVKLLFRPGSTDFWPDPKISGPYPFWLKQIARHTSTAHICLAVVGHSSRTGSEQVNDRLSLQRADAIRARLVAENRELTGKIATSGAGFRENLIGSGTDDQRDSLDRRVEFKVVSCP